MEIASQKVKDNFNPNDINCWIVTEGMAGTENQCLGITDHLNLKNIKIRRVSLRWPFTWLVPFIKKIPKWAIKGIDWNAPAPHLIIASGRKAIPVTQIYPNAFRVFIQNPRISSAYFSLVAAPAHDNLAGENIIKTIGAPNRITQQKLDAAKIHFEKMVGHLPDKKIAVMIGGNSKTHKITLQIAQTIVNQLTPFIDSHEWGVMMSVSRRTPDDITAFLKDKLSQNNCVFYDGQGENPYLGFLAHADSIVVTEDSTSMLSDALTTGKPTYRIKLDGGSDKFNRLYQALENHGGLRPFEGRFDHWDYQPLHDAKMVADEIKKRFAKYA